MKKILSIMLILCLFILISSCASRNDTKDDVEIRTYDDLVVLLYERGAAVDVNYHTAEYEGENLTKLKEYKKTNMDKKKDDLFGKDRSLSYSRTLKSNEIEYEIDEYSYVVGYEAVFASYRSDTKQMVEYKTNVSHNRDYSSAVNPNSSEAEFIKYAKKIFSEWSGVSVDGWDIKIQTWRDEYGYEDKFINYAHENPDYNAEYIFTFSKKISGIERCDKMYIRMTNVGEIIEFNAVNYDEAFAPFNNVQLDLKKLQEAVESSFESDTRALNVSSKKINETTLLVKDGALWVQFFAEYSIGSVKGGLSYIIKVSEVID